MTEMPSQPRQSYSQPTRPAVDLVREAIIAILGDNLDWNVSAYGKAWTGEDEDTEFLVHGAPAAVLDALKAGGYVLAKVCARCDDALIEADPEFTMCGSCLAASLRPLDLA
jgi:hypothetical protein